MAINSGKMESYKEESATPAQALSLWQRELKAAQEHYSKFHEVCESTLKIYRDERENEMNMPLARLNFFWSNVTVIKSTLYIKPPKVDVSRLYRDYGDDTARVAGIMLERLLNHDLEEDASDFDVAARQSLDDWLVIGQGQLWYRYEAEIESEPAPVDPMTGAAPLDGDGKPAMVERVTDEQALSDYVYWKDFLCSPARTWAETRWVARRVYMTRDALVERFGEDIGPRVPLYTRNAQGGKTSGAEASANDPWATAEVWEIWCKTTRRVHWLVVGFDTMLDERDDPLHLENFFPCPQPLLANMTNNTLIPRSDYSMARDQYQQINTLVARLRMLIDACKVAGAYDKEAAPALASILGGHENKMIPVDNWALFSEKGGIKGVMDWVPLDQIASVITVLRGDLAEQKQQLYEVLGISDIMRGATRASETATAQQIKAQFGSTRLQLKQYEFGRFIRDAQRIKAEIIARHFQPATIIARSNIARTPDAPHAERAVQLLKDESISEYRLAIEPESMAALDWANERDARTQFLTAVGGFVQSMAPLAQAQPSSVPVMLQMLSWGLSGFKVGKEIEGLLDQAVQQMQQKPPGPDPQQQAMQQAELKKVQSEGVKNEASALKSRAEAGDVVVDMNTKRMMNFQAATGGVTPTQPGTEAPGAYEGA
jgi:hypothetical protein